MTNWTKEQKKDFLNLGKGEFLMKYTDVSSDEYNEALIALLFG